MNEDSKTDLVGKGLMSIEMSESSKQNKNLMFHKQTTIVTYLITVHIQHILTTIKRLYNKSFLIIVN